MPYMLGLKVNEHAWDYCSKLLWSPLPLFSSVSFSLSVDWYLIWSLYYQTVSRTLDYRDFRSHISVLICLPLVVCYSMFCFLLRAFWFFLSSFLYVFSPFFYFVVLLVAGQYHGRVFSLLLDLWQKLSTQVIAYTELLTHRQCRELMNSVGKLG